MEGIFGVAGVPTNYTGKDFELFDWLKSINLNAYEIQCVYGFKISPKKKEYYKEWGKKGIFLSMHGPYFINLGSLNGDVAKRSKEILKNGIELAKEIDCNRIIFHPGGGHENTKQGRIDAINRIVNYITELENEVDFGSVVLYPEIGGKTANLGSIEEIVEIVNRTNKCFPCIDIAHLHARENGSLQTIDDIRSKFQYLKDNLSPEKFQKIHFHAYTINYNEKGEIKHLVHGQKMPNGEEGKPNLEDFLTVLKEYNLSPWIISEACDSQELGAMYMQRTYEKICDKCKE